MFTIPQMTSEQWYNHILAQIQHKRTLIEQRRSEETLNPAWFDNASKYLHEVRTLVELLEVLTCGSVGGYAPTQPPCRGDLDCRIEWLVQNRPTV